MNRRLLRINDLLRQEISSMISRDVKDPRLGSLVTIMAVETTPDLRFARVFVSVLGDQQQKNEVFLGLRSATRFFRRELGDRLDLKRIPELTWVHDDSIERGVRILSMLDDVTEPKA